MTTFDPRRVRPALRRWSRSPRAYWLGVVIVSLGAGALTWNWLHRAETLARRWGDTRTVLVAATDIDVGSVIDASMTTSRALPIAVLPDDALQDLAPGAIAVVRLGAGTVLIPGAIDAGDGSPLARHVGVDHRAVSLRAEDVTLPVATGDRVVLFGAAGDAPAVVVTAEARVLDADERVVTLSVPTDDTGAALEAIAADSLQLALVGRDP